MRLVLLHALPPDGRQWSGQMELLPGSTIAPTLYRLGNSVEDWAAAVLDMTDDKPLVVVGNSVGGSVALEMARRAPERIEALVLVGTKPAHRPEPEFCQQFIAELAADRRITVRRWVDGFLSPTAADNARDGVHTIAETQLLEDLVTGVRAFHSRPDAGEVAAGWVKPLLIVHGEHDRTRAPTVAARPVRTIPAAGHYVNLEQPSVFNAIVSEVIGAALASLTSAAQGRRDQG